SGQFVIAINGWSFSSVYGLGITYMDRLYDDPVWKSRELHFDSAAMSITLSLDHLAAISALVIAILLLPYVLRLRRFRPRLESDAPTCRYNLTANESGICPECGTPIDAR